MGESAVTNENADKLIFEINNATVKMSNEIEVQIQFLKQLINTQIKLTVVEKWK